MRILASGDHHFDEHSRLAEAVKVHSWMVDVARQQQVDLFLSGGDVYESLSTPIEREAVKEWLLRMGEVCPILITRGNHDRRFDLRILAALRTKHPIIVEEACGVHLVAGAAIAAVAWPEPEFLLPRAPSLEAGYADIRLALQAVLRGLGDQLDQHPGPRVLLGHLMIDGAVTSVAQPLLGQPINCGLADLALARAHLGLASHIHRAQRFYVHHGDPGQPAPHVYLGSPFRDTFGQCEKKTVTLAEFDGQRLVRLEDIETPAAPMVHLEADWFNDAFETRESSDDHCAAEHEGAEVRFRYNFAPEHSVVAHQAAEQFKQELLSMGAKYVKLDPVPIVETRSRAPEVARATTWPAKLEAHWQSKGFQPEPEQRTRLLGKFGELEEQSRA
jgi:DNA repair exonuclease SbcCD nuclease subunit